jgi:hypothetical protein
MQIVRKHDRECEDLENFACFDPDCPRPEGRERLREKWGRSALLSTLIPRNST